MSERYQSTVVSFASSEVVPSADRLIPDKVSRKVGKKLSILKTANGSGFQLIRKLSSF